MRRTTPKFISHNTLVVLILTGFAFGMRLPFWAGSVHFEEAIAFNSFAAESLWATLAQYDHPNNHVLYSYLTWGLWQSLGNHPMLLRLPAVMAGLLTIPLSYIVGRRLYTPRVGLIFTALSAASLSLIQAGVRARGYALLALMTLILILVAERTLRRNRQHDWLLLAGCLFLSGVIVPAAIYPALAVSLWMIHEASHRIDRLITIRRIALMTGSALLLIGVFFQPALISADRETFLNAHLSSALLPPLELHRQADTILRAISNAIGRGLPPGIGWALFVAGGIGLLLHERVAKVRAAPGWAALVATVLVIVGWRSSPEPDYFIGLVPIYLLTVAAGLSSLTVRWTAQRLSTVAYGVCLTLCTWVVFTGAVDGLSDTGYVPDADAIALDLLDELDPGERVVVLAPYDELLRYAFTRHNIGFTPVVNPEKQSVSLDLRSPDIYTLAVAESDAFQASDYLNFGATNLRVEAVPLATYDDQTLQQIIVRSTVPVTTEVRQALFSENFEQDTLDEVWEIEAAQAVRRRVDGNHVLDIDAGDDWAFVTLRDEGRLWIDYSLYGRVRVIESADTKDDVFLHARYLPTIGSYTGSINPTEDVVMLSRDFDQAWLGPLVPVGVRTMPDLEWYTMRVRVAGNGIQLYVDGERLLTTRDDDIQRGSIRIIVPPGNRVWIDDLFVVEEVDAALVAAERADFRVREPNPFRVSPPEQAAIQPRGTMRVGGEEWTFIQLADPTRQSWEDLALETRFRLHETDPDGGDLLLLARQDGRGNYVGVIDVDESTASLGTDLAGVWQGPLSSATYDFEVGAWHTLRIQAVDDSISLLVDGLQIARTLDTRYRSGALTLAIPPGVVMDLDHIVIETRVDVSDES